MSLLTIFLLASGWSTTPRVNGIRRVCKEVTFSADGHELDTLAGDKVKGFVDISDLVEAHLAAVRLGQSLAGDHLQQQHQLQPISEVFIDVFDRGPGFS